VRQVNVPVLVAMLSYHPWAGPFTTTPVYQVSVPVLVGMLISRALLGPTVHEVPVLVGT
jgi:hypothetical protein